MIWYRFGSGECLQERAGGRACGGIIPRFKPSPPAHLQPGEKDGPEAGCHSQGSRIDGWDGSRTPTDATGTGPLEDVECRGWKALEGTPSQQGPTGTADASREAHNR